MRISEFLPNPAGKDADGEWFELHNDASTTQNIRGWFIQNQKGKKFIFSHVELAPDEYVVWSYRTTKLQLRNTNEMLSLYDASGVLRDALGFQGNAREGEGVIRTGETSAFTLSPTPGAANVLVRAPLPKKSVRMQAASSGTEIVSIADRYSTEHSRVHAGSNAMQDSALAGVAVSGIAIACAGAAVALWIAKKAQLLDKKNDAL